jgi:hypothetical protein
MPVTAVTRVLPRYWDGLRLLRFLTGLAMLALAFTVHVTPPALADPPPVTPVASVTSVVSAASPAAAPVETPVVALPASPIETPLAIGSAVTLPLVVGFALRVRAERAPPSA